MPAAPQALEPHVPNARAHERVPEPLRERGRGRAVLRPDHDDGSRARVGEAGKPPPRLLGAVAAEGSAAEELQEALVPTDGLRRADVRRADVRGEVRVRAPLLHRSRLPTHGPADDVEPRRVSRDQKSKPREAKRAVERKTQNTAAAAAAAARGPRGPSARRGGERRWGFGFDDAAADAEIASPRAFVRARASPRVRRRVGRVVFFFFFAQEDGGGDEHELGAPLRGGARGVQRDGGAGGVSQERGLSDAQGVHDREGQFGLALGGVHEVGAPGGVVG